MQHYNYDTFGGITYEVELNGEFGDRVVSMKKDNKDIDLEKHYNVVMNNYRASNISIYLSYDGAEVVGEINIDISEIIINYIQDKKKVNVIDNSNYNIRY